MLNDKTGNFIQTISFTSLATNTNINLADMDNDENIDIILSSFNGVNIGFGLGSAAGFTNETNLLSRQVADSHDRFLGISLNDIDKDSNLDVLIPEIDIPVEAFGGNEIHIISFNQNSRNPSIKTKLIGNESSVFSGDFDGDNNIELSALDTLDSVNILEFYDEKIRAFRSNESMSIDSFEHLAFHGLELST